MKHAAATIACLLLAALIAGCEARSFSATRPDGTTIDYTRWTWMGESGSEGVSITKDGNDLLVEVGPTGSKTDAQIAIEAFGIGAAIGRQQAEQP